MARQFRGGSIRLTVLHDAQLYGRGHMVERWFRDLGQDFESNAKFLAPVNKGPKGSGKKPPGWLKSTIEVNTIRVGERRLQNTLRIRANYAKYVVRGTTGPIEGRSTHAKMSIYAPNLTAYTGATGLPRKGNRYVVATVSGQKRNAFLDRASRITAMQHPSMSGISRRRIGL